MIDDEELKSRLTEGQYRVTRFRATERTAPNAPRIALPSFPMAHGRRVCAIVATSRSSI